jgi:MYXO-CTERM domain-containing protein
MNLLFLLPAALANGQTTHLWISHQAVEELPEGALRSFLEAPANRAALDNGTMFPDGGYAVDHPYGEVAHWEPFQDRLKDWILSEFDSPMDPDAADAVAFYLGLASHGMADQVFDSLYMERSKQHDAAHGWADNQSLDTSSDIVWAALTGPQSPPTPWFPSVMVDLFESAGISVNAETLNLGQERLELAVNLVGNLSANPEGVETHAAHFPWGCGNLHSRSVPGAPYSEAKIIAAYWTDLWAELQGEVPALEVLSSFPKEGGRAHHRLATEVESRLTLVFNRSLLKADVASLAYALTGDSAVPDLEPWLFYRDDSHVVHLIPDQDWAQDSDFSLSLSPGLGATDGRVLETETVVNFSTKPLLDPVAGCTCSTASPKRFPVALGILLLGLALRRPKNDA